MRRIHISFHSFVAPALRQQGLASPSLANPFARTSIPAMVRTQGQRARTIHALASSVTNAELIEAAHIGDLEKLKRWRKENLQASIDEVKDETKRTPLAIACQNSHFDAVKYLVKTCHADANARDTTGRTPLYETIRHHDDQNDVHIMKYLVEEGNADTQVKANGEWTLLHAAALGDSYNAMEYLVLLDKIDINAQDTNGCTPLHKAVSPWDYDVFTSLVDWGADLTIRNSNGATPLQYYFNHGCRGDEALEFYEHIASVLGKGEILPEDWYDYDNDDRCFFYEELLESALGRKRAQGF